jgi:cysteine desulfurase
LPVPLIVGLGMAAELAGAEHADRRARAESVKRSFLAALHEVEHTINGDLRRSQAHVVNVSFHGVDSEALMVELRDAAAVSNGSACASARYASSHVLKAMGMDAATIESALRISWGPGLGALPAAEFAAAVRVIRL